MTDTKGDYDADEYALSIAGAFVHWVFEDERWQPFGFRKVPRKGLVFGRFTDKKILVLEGFIRRELLYVSSYFTCRLVLETCSRDEAVRIVARAMEIALQGLRTWNDNYRLFGFESIADARREFTDAVVQYVSGYPGKWDRVFVERARKSFDAGDGRLHVLVNGSKYLLSEMDWYYQRTLIEARKSAGGRALSGSVRLDDESYLPQAERIVAAIEGNGGAS